MAQLPPIPFSVKVILAKDMQHSTVHSVVGGIRFTWAPTLPDEASPQPTPSTVVASGPRHPAKGRRSPAIQVQIRRRRTIFTTLQHEKLEAQFQRQKYLYKGQCTALSAQLGLTPVIVKTWFQNRRTKWSRECSALAWSYARECAALSKYLHRHKLPTC